jgi:hypothetical protein
MLANQPSATKLEMARNSAEAVTRSVSTWYVRCRLTLLRSPRESTRAASAASRPCCRRAARVRSARRCRWLRRQTQLRWRAAGTAAYVSENIAVNAGRGRGRTPAWSVVGTLETLRDGGECRCDQCLTGRAPARLGANVVDGSSGRRGHRIAIALLKVVDDGLEEMIEAWHGAASKAPLGEVSEDALSQLQPRRTEGTQCGLETSMRLHLGVHAGLEVGGQLSSTKCGSREAGNLGIQFVRGELSWRCRAVNRPATSRLRMSGRRRGR